MAATARRYDFDLVLAGDFRGSGEVAETIASHLASLADRSLAASGCCGLRDPALPARRRVNARIAGWSASIPRYRFRPIIDDLTCRLVLIYEPRLLAARARHAPRSGRTGRWSSSPSRRCDRSGPAFDAGARRRRDRRRHRRPPALVPGLAGHPRQYLRARRRPAAAPPGPAAARADRRVAHASATAPAVPPSPGAHAAPRRRPAAGEP